MLPTGNVYTHCEKDFRRIYPRISDELREINMCKDRSESHHNLIQQSDDDNEVTSNNRTNADTIPSRDMLLSDDSLSDSMTDEHHILNIEHLKGKYCNYYNIYDLY